jgi:hypothetical protein
MTKGLPPPLPHPIIPKPCDPACDNRWGCHNYLLGNNASVAAPMLLSSFASPLRVTRRAHKASLHCDTGIWEQSLHSCKQFPLSPLHPRQTPMHESPTRWCTQGSESVLPDQTSTSWQPGSHHPQHICPAAVTAIVKAHVACTGLPQQCRLHAPSATGVMTGSTHVGCSVELHRHNQHPKRPPRPPRPPSWWSAPLG